MADLSETIHPKSDQLNADDLIGGKTMTIKVTAVKLCAGEQPIAIHFDGDGGKPYKPGKSMRRVLVTLWGSDGNVYVGRSMTIFRDEKVMFGGVAVGGIRISHMSHISEPKTMALTAAKASRKPFTVKPLVVSEPSLADQSVISAGDNASATGVENYTAWLAALTPEVKATIKPYHAAWSKKAKAVDIVTETAKKEPDVIDAGFEEVPI